MSATVSSVKGAIANFIVRQNDLFFKLARSVPYWFVALLARFYVARAFWLSGRSKVEGWNIFDTTAGVEYLFKNEFKLHLFWGTYDFPLPGLMAQLSAIGEHVLPVLLVLGLFSRLSAVGLLGMTAVVQLVMPDGWMNFHLPWAITLLLVLAKGPGLVSIDHWTGLDRN